MDDAFRRQLESVQAAHQAELLQLSNEKHKHIEQANLKVKYGFLFLQKLFVFNVERTSATACYFCVRMIDSQTDTIL